MIFQSDEDRALFASSPSLLQVMVSILEFELAKYNAQIEFIGYEIDIVLVGVDPIKMGQLQHACEKLERMFKRNDKFVSCAIVDQRAMVVKVVASTKEDLKYLI